MAITWTKTWLPADDGTLLKAVDLRNIQDDINSVIVTAPISDTSLEQITTASKVSASALTDFVFWDDEVISYENDLVYFN